MSKQEQELKLTKELNAIANQTIMNMKDVIEAQDMMIKSLQDLIVTYKALIHSVVQK